MSGSSFTAVIPDPYMGVDLYQGKLGAQATLNRTVLTRTSSLNIVSASVAYVDKSPVIVAQPGGSRPLEFWWQDRTPKQAWHEEQVPNSGPPSLRDSGPTIAQVGDSTVIAALGPNGSLDFWWQRIGSPRWNGPETVASAGYSPPGLAQVGNASAIVDAGRLGGAIYYTQPIGAIGWSPAQPIDANAFTAELIFDQPRPAIAQVGNSAMVAAQSGTSELLAFLKGIKGSEWSSPEQVVVASSSVTEPSIAQVGDAAMITSVEGSHAVMAYTQPIGGSHWAPTTVAQLPQDDTLTGASLAVTPGTTTGTTTPAILAIGDRFTGTTGLDVYGDLYWEPNGTGGWSHHEELLGPATGGCICSG